MAGFSTGAFTLYYYRGAHRFGVHFRVAPRDFAGRDFGQRIDRAATQLAVIVHADIERQIADRAWSAYQHQVAGNASPPREP